MLKCIVWLIKRESNFIESNEEVCFDFSPTGLLMQLWGLKINSFIARHIVYSRTSFIWTQSYRID